jgi:hypothetical protein
MTGAAATSLLRRGRLLPATGAAATMDGGGCYHGRGSCYQRCTGVAATSNGGGCYQRCTGAAATSDGGSCYHGQGRLLPWAAEATSGGRYCYNGRWRLLPAAVVTPTSGSDGCSCGVDGSCKRPGGCYKWRRHAAMKPSRPAAMLSAAGGGAARRVHGASGAGGGAASRTRRRCRLSGRRALAMKGRGRMDLF